MDSDIKGHRLRFVKSIPRESCERTRVLRTTFPQDLLAGRADMTESVAVRYRRTNDSRRRFTRYVSATDKPMVLGHARLVATRRDDVVALTPRRSLTRPRRRFTSGLTNLHLTSPGLRLPLSAKRWDLADKTNGQVSVAWPGDFSGCFSSVELQYVL